MSETVFPVFLKAEVARFLIVGGGKMALKKTEMVLKLYPKASITLLSDKISPSLSKVLGKFPHIKTSNKSFTINDLDEVDFVILALDSDAENLALREIAKQKKLPVYLAGKPQLSDFSLTEPYVEKTGRLKISNIRFWIYGLSIPALLLTAYFLGRFISPEEIGRMGTSVLDNLDENILLFILAGFVAQLIDGALGMAYGVTATSFLLSFGMSPAVSSASVHASEVFTSGVSGLMHLKFGNVNSKLFKNLLIPGVIGAILGAYLLTSLEDYNQYIMPIVSAYTLILGIIIIRKALQKKRSRKKVKRLFPLAAAGGFLDSIGGGGWGPIVSSTLIANGKNPRYTIGSVNLAEFFVALASSFTFIATIGFTHWSVILGLIIGGVIAAPIGAFMANKIPTKPMMLFVGILIIITSLKRIFF
ncbi:TSUP family transporter [Flavobacterium macacae]|uniref:Probable membrane transporter protein n=1 Tax=Flavobacterium macacae TaxID=2488993 RepID=A0A3P3W939_9FLAO|nr:TSUP family transporter [Flavobacterium macacae]RRJ91682.1 hypothetical protein EG849_07330 [Flavobacterium macacae]